MLVVEGRLAQVAQAEVPEVALHSQMWPSPMALAWLLLSASAEQEQQADLAVSEETLPLEPQLLSRKAVHQV